MIAVLGESSLASCRELGKALGEGGGNPRIPPRVWEVVVED